MDHSVLQNAAAAVPAAAVEAPGHRVFQSPSNEIWFGTRGLAPDKAVAEATVRRHRRPAPMARCSTAAAAG